MCRFFALQNLPFISIRWKLVGLCVAMVTVPSVVLGLLSYNTLREQVYENIEKDLRIIVLDWRKITDSYLQQKRRILKREEVLVQQRLRSVAEDVRIMLESFYQENGGTPSAEKKKRFFDNIARISLGRSGYVSLLDTDGNYVVSNERQLDGHNLFGMDETKRSFMRTVLQLLKENQGRDYHVMQYKWAVSEKSVPRMKMSVISFFEPWKLIISANIYFTDFKSYDLEGRLKRDLRRHMADQRIGDSGYIWVINRDGEYVVSKDMLRDGEDISQVMDEKGTPIIQEILAIAKKLPLNETAIYYYTWQNLGDLQPYSKLAAITYIPEWNWIMGASAYHKDFLSGLQTIQKDIILVCISAIVVGSLLAYFLASMLLQPVLRLQKLSIQASKGDLNVKIDPEVSASKDEIGDLAKAFDTMVVNLKGMIRQQEETNAILAGAKEEAEAANQAKSDFLARMSHEIRTPLNAVTGLTSVVLKSELTPTQRDYLNKVQIAGGNLLEVINDILDFSKVEAGRLELNHVPFNLDDMLEELIDLFSNRVAVKDLELIFAVSSEVPRQLVGDEGRLTQVLTNLVENAVKFTDQGEVVIHVEPDELQKPLSEKAMLKFRINDTGCGIDAELLPTLFEPFTQADSYLTRKHEGTGLGLAICSRLVELMGGRIWAESTPGKGSEFSFTILVETRKGEQQRYSIPLELHGLKTLVVDDSTIARQLLREQLESFMFNVFEVDSGEKAVEEVSRAAADEPYKLVLLDWKMSGIDGIETARRIHALEIENQRSLEHRSQTPIIIMVTAYGHEAVQKSHDISAIGSLLLKPVKLSQLFNIIMELFSRVRIEALKYEQIPSVPKPNSIAGRKVLVVEDSALNRDVAIALLEEAGLVVETAETGKIAVHMVTRSPSANYDLVFMDIQMPVMDGYEATKSIRQWEKKQSSSAQPLPIIALTAHALKKEREMCLDADMDDYLAKPIDEQELLRVLFKWLKPEKV